MIAHQNLTALKDNLNENNYDLPAA